MFACLIDKICQLNPKTVKGEQDAIYLYNNNKVKLFGIILILILELIRFFFTERTPINFLFLIGCILLFICFLLLIRSHRSLFSMIVTTIGCCTTYSILHFKGAELLIIEAMGSIPVCVLLFTDSFKHALFVLRYIMIQTQFISKRYLIEFAKEKSPEEFVDQLVYVCQIGGVISISAYGFLWNKLNTMKKKLFESNKVSQDSLSKLQTFLFSFSHELRNPINSLLRNLSLALQENIPPHLYEMINTSKVCGDILLQLINNILDSGKADSGMLEVQNVSTRIHDLAARIWSISSELIKRKGITGTLLKEDTLPKFLMLDPYRMTQILLNLIGNCVKFTEKGTIKVTISWIKGAEFVTDSLFKPAPYDEEDEGLFEKASSLASRMESEWKFLRLSLAKRSFKYRELEFDHCEGEQKGYLKNHS